MSLPDRLLDDEALGAFLGGKSAAAVRQMRHRDPGSLPPVIRVGNRVFYDPRDVEAWLAEKKEEAAGGATSLIVSVSSKRRHVAG
ncbi:MAG: DNA-binding protein [Acidobacteria bacterium]|nr:DNA-binding protein [Acidobacteriota bacterium]